MVVADPFDKLDDLLGDESEQSESGPPEGPPEEELGSIPSASEGTRTKESTANFTRAQSINGEGTRTNESIVGKYLAALALLSCHDVASGTCSSD
jgi:hypothetical protein